LNDIPQEPEQMQEQALAPEQPAPVDELPPVAESQPTSGWVAEPEQSDTASEDLFSELAAADAEQPTANQQSVAEGIALTHEKVIQPLPDSEMATQKTDKPFDLQEAIKQSQPEAPDIPAMFAASSSQEAPEQPSLVGAADVPSDTLEQLEKAVDSPHLQDQSQSVTSEQQFQEAEQNSVAAQPLNLGTELTQTNPTQQAPPPVPPPPMMPQFFDADGTSDNPFKNPE
jgi:hypothetical protein